MEAASKDSRVKEGGYLPSVPFFSKDQNRPASAASFPPLQKTQGRGTHSLGNPKRRPMMKEWATRRPACRTNHERMGHPLQKSCPQNKPREMWVTRPVGSVYPVLSGSFSCVKLGPAIRVPGTDDLLSCWNNRALLETRLRSLDPPISQARDCPPARNSKGDYGSALYRA